MAFLIDNALVERLATRLEQAADEALALATQARTALDRADIVTAAPSRLEQLAEQHRHAAGVLRVTVSAVEDNELTTDELALLGGGDPLFGQMRLAGLGGIDVTELDLTMAVMLELGPTAPAPRSVRDLLPSLPEPGVDPDLDEAVERVDRRLFDDFIDGRGVTFDDRGTRNDVVLILQAVYGGQEVVAPAFDGGAYQGAQNAEVDDLDNRELAGLLVTTMFAGRIERQSEQDGRQLAELTGDSNLAAPGEATGDGTNGEITSQSSATEQHYQKIRERTEELEAIEFQRHFVEGAAQAASAALDLTGMLKKGVGVQGVPTPEQLVGLSLNLYVAMRSRQLDEATRAAQEAILDELDALAEDGVNVSYGVGNYFFNDGTGNGVVGDQNFIDGDENRVIGDNNRRVTGADNQVLGDFNHVEGSDNAVSGERNEVDGDFNLVRGNHNQVLAGDDNIVVGDHNKITGDGNEVYGNNNNVSGNGNHSTGSDVYIRGDNNVNTGSDVSITHDGNINLSDNFTSVGDNRTTFEDGHSMSWDFTSPYGSPPADTGDSSGGGSDRDGGYGSSYADTGPPAQDVGGGNYASAGGGQGSSY
jgi:hypothetical protein